MVFYNTLDPIALSLGPLVIRWYGIMYVIAFVIAYWYCYRRIKTKKADLSVSDLDSLIFWVIIGGIIGARMFAVTFWNTDYYLANPLKVFAVWEGGLSFHGGLVGGLVALVAVSKKLKKSFWTLADLLVVPYALGQALGRVGNFINSELYGTVTSLPWGVNFLNETDLIRNPIFRHPNQLYEVAYDLLIFAILYSLRNKGYKKGTLVALFLVLYSVFRFLTEFLRVEHAGILGFTFPQWFNVIMFIVGVSMLAKRYVVCKA